MVVKLALERQKIYLEYKRFLRDMKGCTRRDLIKNDYIRMELGTAESLLHVDRMKTTIFS